MSAAGAVPFLRNSPPRGGVCFDDRVRSPWPGRACISLTMPAMTDPTDALVSFQEYLPTGLPLRPCALHPEVQVMMDEPAPGVTRFTYVTIEDGVVTAMALFVNAEPVKGRMCFNIGYAVPPEYRRQGRAKAIVEAALDELRNGFGRAGVLPIFVEAVVGRDNAASQAVAHVVFSQSPDRIVDEESGKPALHYLLKLEP